MFSLLFAEGDILADWVIKFCEITRLVSIIVIALSAIVLIISTLLQSNANDNASQALSGGHESYYEQNKGGTKEGKLKKITIIMSSIIAICTILYFVTLLINNPV